MDDLEPLCMAIGLNMDFDLRQGSIHEAEHFGPMISPFWLDQITERYTPIRFVSGYPLKGLNVQETVT